MGRIDQPGRIVGTLGEMTPSSVQVTFAPRVFMLPDTKRWDTFIWCPWLYVFSEFIRAKMHSVLQGTTCSRKLGFPAGAAQPMTLCVRVCVLVGFGNPVQRIVKEPTSLNVVKLLCFNI